MSHKCDFILFRQINSNGAHVAVERCRLCGRNPNKGKPFLSKKDIPNFDELPLLVDYSKQSEPCVVCGSKDGSEYHHFAPRHLFDNADEWPTGWLCMKHHNEWHKKTRTGSFYK